MKFLWLNLADLTTENMTMPGMGSPINMLVQPHLGDERLPGAYSKVGGNADDAFIIIECADHSRPQAILDGLTLIAKRKIGRPVRSRVTTKRPGKAWRFQG